MADDSTHRPNDASSPTAGRVADELEIRNVIARLAHVVDSGDLDTYAHLFTSDAVWTTDANPVLGMEAQRVEGRDALVEGARTRQADGVQGPGTNSRHIVTAVVVTFTGDDTATTDASWLYVTNTLEAPTVRAVGMYRTEMRRDAGRWKVAARHLIQG